MDSEKLIVRQATHEDSDAILPLHAQCWRETVFNDLPFDARSYSAVLESTIDEKICFVALLDDKIVGFFAGVLCPLPSNANYCQCFEVGWWVIPDYRNQGIGKIILNCVENELKKRDVMALTINTLGSMVRGSQFEAKQGYKLAEIAYTKRLDI